MSYAEIFGVWATLFYVSFNVCLRIHRTPLFLCCFHAKWPIQMYMAINKIYILRDVSFSTISARGENRPKQQLFSFRIKWVFRLCCNVSYTSDGSGSSNMHEITKLLAQAAIACHTYHSYVRTSKIFQNLANQTYAIILYVLFHPCQRTYAWIVSFRYPSPMTDLEFQ